MAGAALPGRRRGSGPLGVGAGQRAVGCRTSRQQTDEADRKQNFYGDKTVCYFHFLRTMFRSLCHSPGSATEVPGLRQVCDMERDV